MRIAEGGGAAGPSGVPLRRSEEVYRQQQHIGQLLLQLFVVLAGCRIALVAVAVVVAALIGVVLSGLIPVAVTAVPIAVIVALLRCTDTGAAAGF